MVADASYSEGCSELTSGYSSYSCTLREEGHGSAKGVTAAAVLRGYRVAQLQAETIV